MRPVTNKGAAPPVGSVYEGVYNAGLVFDYEYKANGQLKGIDDFYTLCRNNHNFNNNLPYPDRPVLVAAGPPGSVHLYQTYNPNALTIQVQSGSGAQQMSITPVIELVHVVSENNSRLVRLRVKLPFDAGLDLIRIQKENAAWGGTHALPASLTAAAAKKIKDLTESSYGAAKQDLMDSLGGYCSYCELPGASSNFDVEHKLPKAEWPTEEMPWGNFTLACKRCNSGAKKNKPDRIFGIRSAAWGVNAPPQNWTNLTSAQQRDASNNNLPNPPLQYHSIRDAAAQHWLWPDVELQTYYAYTYRLVYEQSGTAVDAAIATDARSGVMDGDAINNQIFATLYDPSQQGPPNRVRVEVRLARRQFANTAANFAVRNYAADQTLAELKLNEVIRPSPGHSADERIYYRTLAWFKAVRRLRRMEQLTAEYARMTQYPVRTYLEQNYPQLLAYWMVRRAVGDGQIATFVNRIQEDDWDRICADIEASGFYSVWLTVARIINLGVAQQLVQRLHTRAVNNPSLTFFRGTDPNTVTPYL